MNLLSGGTSIPEFNDLLEIIRKYIEQSDQSYQKVLSLECAIYLSKIERFTIMLLGNDAQRGLLLEILSAMSCEARQQDTSGSKFEYS